MKTLFIIGALTLFSFASLSQSQPAFRPGCTLPFDDIKVRHNLDKTCPIQGAATRTNTAANRKQNKVKNNFCATGNSKAMKAKDFIDLHKKVMDQGISFGTASKVPEDRSGLEGLGEGTVVSFTGYVNHAKYSNVGKGESVNCKKGGQENNDIHLELTEKKTEEDLCLRVSAEISPHYRPEEWNVSNLEEVQDRRLKIRITGQLMFDASHGACPDNPEDGYRASSWEIHPVYRIEVYEGGEWTDLHVWIEE